MELKVFVLLVHNSFMEETLQWELALLVGIPIAVSLAWFNKSGSDFKDGFKNQQKKKKK